jgi:DNA-binding IclR family transcriptional regulator
VSCVAAPLLHNGHLVAAFALSVPTERFRERRAALTTTLLEITGSVHIEE